MIRSAPKIEANAPSAPAYEGHLSRPMRAPLTTRATPSTTTTSASAQIWSAVPEEVELARFALNARHEKLNARYAAAPKSTREPLVFDSNDPTPVGTPVESYLRLDRVID